MLLMGKSTINIYKWPFSIAMLVYRRVNLIINGSIPARRLAQDREANLHENITLCLETLKIPMSV